MKHITLIALLFLFSCKKEDKEIGKLENYQLTEKQVSNDCNMYQMLFSDGEYIFRFALAGSCTKLTIEKYTKAYATYLNHHNDVLINRTGLIIFDLRKFDNLNNELENTILTISKSYFKKNVTIVARDVNSFTIKVF